MSTEARPRAGRASIRRFLEMMGVGATHRRDDGVRRALYDALGLNPGFTPRFLKRFASLHAAALEGVQTYAHEVREGTYPDPQHSLEAD